MKKTRRKFSSSFKTKVVLEALKERYTMSELSEKFGIHPNQIAAWKREFLKNAENVFESATQKPSDKQLQKEREEFYKQIGQLKVENEWLKKKVL